MTAISLARRVTVEPAKHLLGPRRWTSWRRRYLTLREKAVHAAENRRWRVSPPRLIFVSEGGREGRHIYADFLDWLGRERRSMRRHIHLDCLPCRMPSEAVLFHGLVQDPVVERDAGVHAQLAQLEAECARRRISVVHPSAILSNTRRDVLCERLSRARIGTPRIAVVDGKFPAHRGSLDLPMVVRRRWGHAVDMRRLDTEAGFDDWWAHARADPGSWVAGEFVDVRSGDGLYRKRRYFMAGSRGCPRHLIVSPHWEVRPSDRVRTRATREEELAFVAAPCPHHALFDAARRALEFEIAAFDYSYDANGGLVVWEVNPYPDLSRPPGEVGEYLAPAVERSYAILADFYAERAGLAVSVGAVA